MYECRAFRLRFTAVKHPASANSVQLAKLDLYTSAAPQSSPPSGLAEAILALQEAMKQAQQAQHAAAQKAAGTLLLVLSNVAQQPDEQKFRTLKLGNPRIQDMLSSAAGPQVRAVLEAVGKPAPKSALTGGSTCVYTEMLVFKTVPNVLQAWAVQHCHASWHPLIATRAMQAVLC